MSTHNPYEGTTPIFVEHVADAAEPEEVSVETPAEETPQTTAAPAVDPVPEGTAKEVLAWVGEDKERAARALVAEVEGNDRKTLVKALREIL